MTTDDEVAKVTRAKKPSSSQRAVLTQEYSERTKFLTYGQYFGRLIFLGILLAIGIHGAGNELFRLAVMNGVILFGGFWIVDNLRQNNQLRRLRLLIASFEERTSPKYWEENYIRYEYGLSYSIQERYLRQVQLFEPLLWMTSAITLLLVRLPGVS